MSNLEAIKASIDDKRRRHAQAAVAIETYSSKIKETRRTLKNDFQVESADQYKSRVAKYEKEISDAEAELLAALETAEGSQ